MRVVVFETPEEQAVGLQWRKVVEPDTLFAFPKIGPGQLFHSRNVAEPFDIAFISQDFIVLQKDLVSPPHGIVVSPAGTALAVEAKAGWLDFWGFLPGRHVRF
jgi:uncharacterized membrane protein (UPF0127 family)